MRRRGTQAGGDGGREAGRGGVDTGMNLRLQGKGETGKGGNGTLYVVINVRDHPVFERDGNDVHVKVSVSIAEAALGASVPWVFGPPWAQVLQHQSCVYLPLPVTGMAAPFP